MLFPPLIIGAMRLGSWGAQLSTTDLESFIQQSIELGLTHFDHADIYGHYSSEADFGKVLRQQPELRSKIQLTTKCGICMTSDNRPAHKIMSYNSSAKHIIASAENSLKELATDYLDVLLIHRPDYLMDPQEIAEAFAKLLKAGKVRHFGVSNFTRDQFELLNGYFPLVTNQLEISISHLNAFEDGTLLQCQQHRIFPTAWSPLGGGQLFQKSDDPKINRIQKTGNELAEKYNCTLDQLFIAWLLKHPAGIIPVTGTTRIDRIKTTLAATKIELEREDWYRLWKASTGEEIA